MSVRYAYLVWGACVLATPARGAEAIVPAAAIPAIPSAKPSRAFQPILHVLPPRRDASLGMPPREAAATAPQAPLSALAYAEPTTAMTMPAAASPPAPRLVEPPAIAVAPPSPDIRLARGRRDLAARGEAHPELDRLIAAHARANNIPEAMVHRIVIRESRYNPRAVGRGGAMGLMQIKHATARAMGYGGTPAGLLDADTNLRYAVPYLAGAYRTADGNPDRTVAYYAAGYYYAAKRKGLAPARPSQLTAADTDGLTQAQRAAAARPSLFSIFTGTAKPMDPNQVPGRRD